MWNRWRNKKKNKTVALVLSSGGARGLAHIGVIQELERRGYKIRSLAGSSMGALVAGLYAVDRLQIYEEWIRGLDKLDILRMIDLTLTDVGFIKGEKVFDQMRKLHMIPEIRIEDLPLPYAAVAVDLISNKEKVFTAGDLEQAIRASIAIPLVFTPVQAKGAVLVDGGVLSPLPLEWVDRTEEDLLVAVDLNAPIPYTAAHTERVQKQSQEEDKKPGIAPPLIKDLLKKWDELFGHKNNRTLGEQEQEEEEVKIGSFDLIMRSVQLMQHRLTTYALARTPPDILIQISKECATVFEFYRAAELIEYGRRVCTEALDQYERKE